MEWYRIDCFKCQVGEKKRFRVLYIVKKKMQKHSFDSCFLLQMSSVLCERWSFKVLLVGLFRCIQSESVLTVRGQRSYLQEGPEVQPLQERLPFQHLPVEKQTVKKWSLHAPKQLNDTVECIQSREAALDTMSSYYLRATTSGDTLWNEDFMRTICLPMIAVTPIGGYCTDLTLAKTCICWPF